MSQTVSSTNGTRNGLLRSRRGDHDYAGIRTVSRAPRPASHAQRFAAKEISNQNIHHWIHVRVGANLVGDS